jgi:protein-tyrosine phosphatase
MRHVYLTWVFLISSLVLACTGPLPPEQRVIPSTLPETSREAARRLPLEGAHNFRDVGGYATSEGRQVRWGVLYRSDKLSELTDDDVAYLSRLSLQRVIDFRSDGERQRDPDRLPDGVDTTLLPIEGEGLDPSQIEALIREGDAEATAQILVTGNDAFVRSFSLQYRAFLLALAEPDNLPLLFHCTGGKDRAGFGAALALMAVGVPRDVVMRDYLLTQEYTADVTAQRIRNIRLMTLWSMDAEAIAALHSARPEYLQAAFDAIDDQYGSTEAYIRDGLGIDATTLARIRTNLLEPR